MHKSRLFLAILFVLSFVLIGLGYSKTFVIEKTVQKSEYKVFCKILFDTVSILAVNDLGKWESIDLKTFINNPEKYAQLDTQGNFLASFIIDLDGTLVRYDVDSYYLRRTVNACNSISNKPNGKIKVPDDKMKVQFQISGIVLLILSFLMLFLFVLKRCKCTNPIPLINTNITFFD